MITIKKVNESFISVTGDYGHLEKIKDRFSFMVKGAIFSKAYKNGIWDGKKYLFNMATKQLYIGLYDELIDYLETNNIEYESNYKHIKDKVSLNSVIEYAENVGLPFKLREYQMFGIYTALKNRRGVLLSATSSGKSAIQYVTAKYLVDKGKRIIIVVPRISLVEQLYGDFEEYGMDVKKNLHRIYSGKSSETNKPIIVTTFQSLKSIKRSILKDIDAVFVDEAHNSSNNTLKTFLCTMSHCKYKLGFTGTLSGNRCDDSLVKGLFGEVVEVITPKQLIEMGYAPKLEIKVHVLRHPTKKFYAYEDEVEHICSNEIRNEYIKSLCGKLSGNTLVLFSRIETHGNVILENVKKLKKKDVYYVYGGTDVEDRERVRKLTEKNDDVIICASYGVFSTGVNIKRLHNIIFASSTKSKVTGLQSIGRGLRKHSTKEKVTVYDLVDDYSGGDKKKINYTLSHFKTRLKYYKEEGFDIDITNVEVAES